MMILRFLFYAFLLYLAFKLVFNLIIPIYRTTRKLRKGFREMQDQMNQANGQGPAPAVKSESGSERKSAKNDDYIEFEEIK